MVNYDGKTNYQALIDQSVKAGNYGQAALYEQQRNAKINDMNAAGTNTTNQQLTNNYSGYLYGGSGGITPAQQMAQQLSPATASQRKLVMDNMIGSLGGGTAPAYQAPNTSAQDAQVAEALATLQNRQYQAPSFNNYYQERSLDDYVNEAIRLLEPSYAAKYDQARATAAQNLDRAGLYNSLYGQSLAQNAENAVTRSLLADASAQAQQQRQQDYENAFRLYQQAAEDAQFAYNAEGNRLNTVINSLHNSIDEIMDRAGQLNDYNLQAAAQDIQRQTAAVDALYQAGRIDAMEYENLLTQAQTRAAEINASANQAELNQMLGVQSGGVYQVGKDGKAPKGLAIGDYVKTQGGYYQITGIAADGSYLSKQMPSSFNPYAQAAPVEASGGYYSGGGGGGGGRGGSSSSGSSSSSGTSVSSSSSKPSSSTASALGAGALTNTLLARIGSKK